MGIKEPISEVCNELILFLLTQLDESPDCFPERILVVASQGPRASLSFSRPLWFPVLLGASSYFQDFPVFPLIQYFLSELLTSSVNQLI